MKVEIPERDAALIYLGILQNLAQRPDLTELERQALDFASCLIHQSLYDEIPEEEEDVEIRVRREHEGEGKSSEEKEREESMESARSVYDLAIMRGRDNAEQ